MAIYYWAEGHSTSTQRWSYLLIKINVPGLDNHSPFGLAARAENTARDLQRK